MAESLETGLILMLTGMGTVLVLLALLVWLVKGVSQFSRWLDPAAAAPHAAPLPAPKPAADGELVSVIGAAIKAHRDRRSRR
jgi:sodium pump decarboxylase gamma subunit